MDATPFSLQGKVAVITGSSRGIGRSIAETMAGLGASVVISSRKPEACAEVADAIRAGGGEAIALPCNISRKDEIEALIAGTEQQLGAPDILVCNAAVNPYFGPLAGISDEAFDKIMASNVRSNLWLCNRVIPAMKKNGGGAIVIVSSIAGLQGNGVLGAYGISKAADFALARNLAVEHGPFNVRVNCIAPGLIKTDFARALWENEDIVRQRNAVTPLRRIGLPEEIGPIAAFLASPAASFITGQVIIADGGVTIA
ncbi:MAG: dehydrogenase [Alphaproteobacteria bacterium]|nr:MAG: dehydrogenase [Alphaproteobacteria bacterium]